MYKGKVKMTNKEINTLADVVIAIGYCGLQGPLGWYDPVAYNRGVYGWNWDAYLCNRKGKRIAIVTGYRNLTGVRIPYELSERYNKFYDNRTDAETAINSVIDWVLENE